METIYLIVTNEKLGWRTSVSPLLPPPNEPRSDHNNTVYVAGEDTNTTKPLRRNLNDFDEGYINFK